MVTPDELRALADGFGLPSEQVVQIRVAARYLADGGRQGLETAHNLMTDVVTSLVLRGVEPGPDIRAAEEALYEARIAAYGSVGRQPDMTPPYWRP